MNQTPSESWDRFIGADVIVDTGSRFIYIGRAAEADPWFLVLEDADVHDADEGSASKERYVMDSRKYGIKKNRTRVSIRVPTIISISRLEDVIDY